MPMGRTGIDRHMPPGIDMSRLFKALVLGRSTLGLSRPELVNILISGHACTRQCPYDLNRTGLNLSMPLGIQKPGLVNALRVKPAWTFKFP